MPGVNVRRCMNSSYLSMLLLLPWTHSRAAQSPPSQACHRFYPLTVDHNTSTTICESASHHLSLPLQSLIFNTHLNPYNNSFYCATIHPLLCNSSVASSSLFFQATAEMINWKSDAAFKKLMAATIAAHDLKVILSLLHHFSGIQVTTIRYKDGTVKSFSMTL